MLKNNFLMNIYRQHKYTECATQYCNYKSVEFPFLRAFLMDTDCCGT